MVVDPWARSDHRQRLMRSLYALRSLAGGSDAAHRMLAVAHVPHLDLLTCFVCSLAYSCAPFTTPHIGAELLVIVKVQLSTAVVYRLYTQISFRHLYSNTVDD